MSARTPFLPRPASSLARPTGTSDQNVKAPTTHKGLPFIPDPSHPLNRNQYENKENLPDLGGLTSSRSLNLSSLRKTPAVSFGGPRKSMDQRTARPANQEQASQIDFGHTQNKINGSFEVASPVPRALGRPTPPLLSNADPSELTSLMPPPGFTTESSSFSVNPPPAHNSNRHILGHHQDGSVANSSFKRTIHVSTAFVDQGLKASGFGSDTPFADQGGPRRMLVEHPNSARDNQRLEDQPHEADASYSSVNRKKRSRADFDESFDHPDQVSQMKRAKYAEQNAADSETLKTSLMTSQRPQSGNRPSPNHRHDFSAHVTQDGIHMDHYHADPGNALSDPAQQPFFPTGQPPTASVAALGALSKIFGNNVEHYLEDYDARYEADMARWANCSMDEWIAGADEITDKLAKIIDSIKDHMTAKVKLFASMSKNVDAHKALLEDRKMNLAAAKEQLIRRNGPIFGR
ncbi:hypothetical protein HGRIS_000970 [Hohenbuehelia grisea]|uniref:Extracellular mutant protein 11 C-terminal domain-containing protein n=1 Tax=Hohenbuehelia grisea TaxID=104357 RepID=A0ABR3IQC2_9AGAR